MGRGMNQSKVTAVCLGPRDALDQTIVAMDDGRFERAYAAWARYDRRQRRVEHPDGYLDPKGLWLPSAGEQTEMLRNARAPTATYPTSYRVACRSLQHCAELEGADHGDAILVKYWVRGIEVRVRGQVADARAYRSAWKLEVDLTIMAPSPPPRAPRRLRL